MDEVEFGRYRLISLIGEGGMGKVYKAHDTLIDRDMAIKVLPTELANEPGYRERFRREAYTAARLTEPHIIPIPAGLDYRLRTPGDLRYYAAAAGITIPDPPPRGRLRR